jgi:hypothetical protein
MGMGGGGGGAPATNTVQQQTVPAFLESAYLEGIDRARSVSNEQFTPYDGPRVAGFSPEQQRAFNMAEQGIGQFAPAYNRGVQASYNAATPFSADQIDPYMNPYKAQVTDEIARLGNKNFSDTLMPQINSQFTGNGMFGSSRNAVALGRAAENTQRDISGQQGQYLSQGFQSAMQNLQADKAGQLAAGAQLANQAGQGQQLYGTDVNALANVGQQKQGQQQTLADIGYNQFLEQQQYPQVQAQWFNNIVRGIPTSGLVTSQTQQYGAQGNQLAQALGLGGTLYGAVNGAPEIKAKLNKGGHIKAKKAKAQTKKSEGVGIGGMMYG